MHRIFKAEIEGLGEGGEGRDAGGQRDIGLTCIVIDLLFNGGLVSC